MSDLEKRQAIGPALEIYCQNHTEHKSLVSSKEDLQKKHLTVVAISDVDIACRADTLAKVIVTLLMLNIKLNSINASKNVNFK